MSTFPLVINFQGDYGMKLVMVDPDSTMDNVAQIAKANLVGVVVPPLEPGTVLKVRRHGTDLPLAGTLKIKDAGFIRMETVDVYHS